MLPKQTAIVHAVHVLLLLDQQTLLLLKDDEGDDDLDVHHVC